MKIPSQLSIVLSSVKKDLNRLFSSQFSAGLLLLGPLLLIGLVGFAFQTNDLTDITIGVHNDVQDLNETITTLIEEKDYQVQYYNEPQPCIDDNKNGKSAACLSLKGNQSQLQADVYLDFSRSQFAAAVLNEVNNVFDNLRDQKLRTFADNLGERAESLDTKLSTFQTRIDTATSDLSETQQAVNNIDLEYDEANRTLQSIPEINQELTSIKQRLNQTKTYLDDISVSIEDNKESVNQQRNRAASLLEQRGCQDEYESIDSLSSEEITALFASKDKPGCVLVWNYKKHFDQRAKSLNTIEDGIVSQRKQILAYQNQSETIAATRLTELIGDELDSARQRQQRLKQNLSRGLEELRSGLNRSAVQIRSLQDAGLLDALRQAESAVNPVNVTIKRHEELKSLTILEVLFPGILTTLVSFVGILVGSTLTMKERLSNAGFRNKISPFPTKLLQFSSTITGAMISAIQVIVVLLVAMIAFGLQTRFTLGLIPFLIFTGAVFTLIGQIIGSLSPNQEVSALLSIITAVLLLIFSSLITPLEKLHQALGTIFSYTPFNQTMHVLRRQLIFGESVAAVPLGITTLILYVTVAIVVLLWTKWDE